MATKKTQTKADIEKELVETQSALQEALALIKELKEQKTQPVIIQQDKTRMSKIKCINLAHNPVNVSTLPDGQGRLYTFTEYGQAHFIKYDDLLDIVSSYPKTIESGVIYIADRDFCEEQGIYNDTNNVYTKDIMDELVCMRDDKDVDLFVGMSKPLQETTAYEIARLYRLGEKIEPNKLARIKDESGYDIVAMSKDVVDIE